MEGHVVKPLAVRQRDVLRLIARYHVANDEFPSVRWLAQRLGLHHSTVQDHLTALFRKGWLTSPSPEGLRCPHV